MPSGYVTAESLARYLGVTKQRVSQLKSEGVVVTELVEDDGKEVELCDISRSAYNYIRKLQERLDRRREPDEDEAALEKRKLAAETKFKESRATIEDLKKRELQGSMHRAEDVERIVGDHVMAVRAEILSLPGMLAVDCAASSSAQECAGIIKRACAEVIENLRGYAYDPQKYRALVQEREKWMNEPEQEEAGH